MADVSDPTTDEWRRGRVRTFHGRHGRVTERMQDVYDRLGSRHGLDVRPDPTRPLVIEIGCGNGDAARAFCAASPETDVLAVDVHTPGVITLLEVCASGEVPNLYVERADGLDVLDDRIAPGSLAGLHLFFPDPWPKAKHHKRRFVRADVLDLVADRLAPGAPLRIATDVADYADWSRSRLAAHRSFCADGEERPAWRPVTHYERVGLDAGRVAIDLCYRRRQP